MSNKNSFSEASAKSYSQALYELGSEEKNLEKLEGDVNSIIKLISQSENFNSLIKDPTNNQEDQINVINIIFEKLQLPVIAVNSKDSSGLHDTLKHHFPNNFENKIQQYEKLGPRQIMHLKSKNELYLRIRGCTVEDCKTLLDKITLQGSVPEPLRVSHTLAKTLLKTSLQ